MQIIKVNKNNYARPPVPGLLALSRVMESEGVTCYYYRLPRAVAGGVLIAADRDQCASIYLMEVDISSCQECCDVAMMWPSNYSPLSGLIGVASGGKVTNKTGLFAQLLSLC
jgi:hypothetical protein